LQQLHGIRTAHDYVTAEKQPADSDNSKSPQDAAIRYEPAAAVKQHFFKTKPSSDNNDINDEHFNNKHLNHHLTRLQTSPAPTHNNDQQSALQHHKTEASPRSTAATLKMTTFEFPACQ
jgi:hypothetical protein